MECVQGGEGGIVVVTGMGGVSDTMVVLVENV